MTLLLVNVLAREALLSSLHRRKSLSRMKPSLTLLIQSSQSGRSKVHIVSILDDFVVVQDARLAAKV